MARTLPILTERDFDWPVAAVEQTPCREYTVLVVYDEHGHAERPTYDMPIGYMELHTGARVEHDSTGLSYLSCVPAAHRDDLEGLVTEYDDDGEIEEEGEFENMAEFMAWRLDLGTAEFSSDRRAYVMFWSKTEWRKYAGEGSSDPCPQELEDWMNGHIYGFEVHKTAELAIDDGEGGYETAIGRMCEDSCWGFIGEDLKYPMTQGLDNAQSTVTHARKNWATWLKPKLRHRAPLEMRWATAQQTKYGDHS